MDFFGRSIMSSSLSSTFSWRTFTTVYMLQFIYTVTANEEPVTEAPETSRQWFLYGSLITLAAAFIFLMSFLCVYFCPCSSQKVDKTKNGGLENKAYEGTTPVDEQDVATYELSRIESHNSRNASNGHNRTSNDSVVLVGVKKLQDSSEQISSNENKRVIETEIHETIHDLSESIDINNDVSK